MTDIFDFLQLKNAKEERIFEKIFQKGFSLDEKLEELLRHKTLNINDHQLFLAFLTYTETKGMDVKKIFQDVITLPKFQFEQIYKINWSQVVKLAVTFLSILQQSSPAEYEKFKGSIKNIEMT